MGDYFGVEIQPLLFEGLINDKGIMVDWYRAQRCGCRDEDGHPQSSCMICGYTGWQRSAPVPIRGLLLSDSPKRNRDKAGNYDTDTRQFTPPLDIRLDEGDLIVMKQSPRRSSENLVYGAPAGRDDRLNAMFVSQVLGVTAVRNDLTVLHTFAPTLYTDPVGVAVLPDGTINWQVLVALPADLPGPGEQVTVEYMHYETYQVARDPMPMNRFAQDKRLQDKVTVKLATRRFLRTT